MISKSQEEYLKTIYLLKKQYGNIRVTDIAERMNCSKPSVNKAINNLKESSLINYETYGEIELTKDGEDYAKKLLEAYDISYNFLKNILELSDENAKVEAEKLKSSLSDETLNSLAKYVHKVLGIYSLDCAYDLNNERCRTCVRSSFEKNNKN